MIKHAIYIFKISIKNTETKKLYSHDPTPKTTPKLKNYDPQNPTSINCSPKLKVKYTRKTKLHNNNKFVLT